MLAAPLHTPTSNTQFSPLHILGSGNCYLSCREQHLSGCEVASHHAFVHAFLVAGDAEHLLMCSGQACIFSREMSVQSLCIY